MSTFAESLVEEVARAWLRDLGWSVRHRSSIAPSVGEGRRRWP